MEMLCKGKQKRAEAPEYHAQQKTTGAISPP